MQVKKGDILAYSQYVEVIGGNDNAIDVRDIHTESEFKITGNDLIQAGLSANWFASEKQATKTQLAELLVNSNGKPFTVVFIRDDGERRELVGRLLSVQSLLGRSKVEEFNKPKKDRIREVDHRTIQSLILEGTKWVLKS